jgi:uncharacterized protein
MRIIRRASFTAVPWKNGGGITHEAIRVPASGEPFLWRVSVAEVATSGPFSDFSSYDRKMVLLKGGGVALRFANGTKQALAAVGDLAEFDGALAAECELVDGACVDLNLIVAKRLPDVRARVARVGDGLTIRRAAHEVILAFAIDRSMELFAAGGSALLQPWDLALVPDGEELTVRPAGGDGPTGAAGVAGVATGAAAGAMVFLAALPAQYL